MERAVIVHHSRAGLDAASRGYELILEDMKPSFALCHFWPGNGVRVRATDDDTRATLRSTWLFAGPALRALVRRLLDLVRNAAESGPERAEGGDRAGDHDDAEHLHAG